MSIPIDHAAAKKILFSESDAAQQNSLPTTATEWFQVVQELSDLCPHGRSATVIAALGTAILAKCTEPRVDVYALLDRGEAEFSYSARSLADNVWARHRAELGIDLGANGTNPLNNTPFIGKTRIDEITGVRNVEGWQFFIAALEKLKNVRDTQTARLALRGFLAARRRGLLERIAIDPQLGDNLSMAGLASLLTSYVSASSEGGRRAQACSAGILDAVFGPSQVVVGCINDPDRRSPLDVAVLQSENVFIHAFEVKDKPITGTHVFASIEKAVKVHNLRSLTFLAVSSGQIETQFSEVERWAADRGVKVTMFVDWYTFLTACRCFSLPGDDYFEGRTLRYVIRRAEELGVATGPLHELMGNSQD